jgi:hypothetical protein
MSHFRHTDASGDPRLTRGPLSGNAINVSRMSVILGYTDMSVLLRRLELEHAFVTKSPAET